MLLLKSLKAAFYSWDTIQSPTRGLLGPAWSDPTQSFRLPPRLAVFWPHWPFSQRSPLLGVLQGTLPLCGMLFSVYFTHPYFVHFKCHFIIGTCYGSVYTFGIVELGRLTYRAKYFCREKKPIPLTPIQSRTFLLYSIVILFFSFTALIIILSYIFICLMSNPPQDHKP